MPDNIPTARGLTAVALSMFQLRHPGLHIDSEVINGEDTHYVFVSRNIANRAARRSRYNACECGVAIPTTAQIPGAIDTFVNRNGGYVLVVTDDVGQMVKYDHSGSGVVDSVDAGERMTVDALVTWRPPAPSRRVGAQSQALKSNPAGARRGPQSAEHIAKRMEHIEGSLRRISEAAKLVAEEGA